MFASSEFVATFASAFEKNRLSGPIGILETIESVRKPVAKPNPIEKWQSKRFDLRKCKVLEEKFAGLKR